MTESSDTMTDSPDTVTANPDAMADAALATPPTRGRPLWVAYAAIAGAVVIVDQITKAWVVSAVPPGGSIPVIGDLVRLIITHNTGAIFGLFRDQAGLFAIASIAVLGAILVYHAKSGRSPLMTLTLALLFGGAIGNFVDRIRLGYVVDFVDAGIGDLRFYTFNVADSAISAAILLLILLALRPSLAEPRPTAAERAAGQRPAGGPRAVAPPADSQADDA